MKIDNVSAARPQTGIGSADIVFFEQVEAGLTRLLAVYSSQLPPAAGPVRSARESDAGGAPAAYYRSSNRAAPHNLYLRPARALSAAPAASVAPDIGFRFGAAPVGGKQTARRTVHFPAAAFAFVWSAKQHGWLVSMDGHPARTTDGGRLKAATVVIQRVTVRPSRFHDRGGNITPFSATVGSGSATVLRDGQAFGARWSRPAAGGGTSFTTRGGEVLPFARGPVWVVLAAR